jgi:hypothetical protein
MSAAFPVLIFVFALVLNVAGCASPSQPQEMPINSNIADKAASGEENPFAKAYVSRNLSPASLQHDTDSPKVYRGEDQVDDYQRMLENGYDMLGYSEFIAGSDTPPELVLQQARKINADLALVYTRLSGEAPADVKLQQMRERAKNAGQGSGQSPESQVSYTYFASYWAKLSPPLLGVHVMGPATDEETDGLRVIAVINESPAAKAGVQEGDVLERLGDVDLKSPAALTQAAQRYAGQTVDLRMQRSGTGNQLKVTLNGRH